MFIRKWQTLISILLESMNRELTTILRQVKIFPSPQQEEDQLGNQTEESKKLHSEENLKELN